MKYIVLLRLYFRLFALVGFIYMNRNVFRVSEYAFFILFFSIYFWKKDCFFSKLVKMNIHETLRQKPSKYSFDIQIENFGHEKFFLKFLKFAFKWIFGMKFSVSLIYRFLLAFYYCSVHSMIPSRRLNVYHDWLANIYMNGNLDRYNIFFFSPVVSFVQRVLFILLLYHTNWALCTTHVYIDDVFVRLYCCALFIYNFFSCCFSLFTHIWCLQMCECVCTRVVARKNLPANILFILSIE